MKESRRFQVQSERLPAGEPRTYYVIDKGPQTALERRYFATLPRRPAISSDFGKNQSPYRSMVGENFYEKRAEANAECKRLNIEFAQVVHAWLKER